MWSVPSATVVVFEVNDGATMFKIWFNLLVVLEKLIFHADHIKVQQIL
jgi:hypothetical protein